MAYVLFEETAKLTPAQLSDVRATATARARKLVDMAIDSTIDNTSPDEETGNQYRTERGVILLGDVAKAHLEDDLVHLHFEDDPEVKEDLRKGYIEVGGFEIDVTVYAPNRHGELTLAEWDFGAGVNGRDIYSVSGTTRL